MLTLQGNPRPRGHVSSPSESLETRPSGGYSQPLLLLFLCAYFPFFALLKPLNSWQAGEMKIGLRRLARDCPSLGLSVPSWGMGMD